MFDYEFSGAATLVVKENCRECEGYGRLQYGYFCNTCNGKGYIEENLTLTKFCELLKRINTKKETGDEPND